MKMAQVVVLEGFYRGEMVSGLFELAQDFTAFKGEGRRNGLKGTGFIKVAVVGDQLMRLAPNAKPVKITVAGLDNGYRVLLDTVSVEFPEAEGEAPVAEFGVDAERELADAEGFVEEVRSVLNGQAGLAELRAAFEAAKGGERDRLRKRLRRMEAKLAA
jgi:hypothetical protein